MQLYMDKIIVTTHAQERAIERFELKNTKPSEVSKYIKKNLVRAEYVGSVTCTDGSESELFVNGLMGFHLTPDFSKVKTIIKIHKVPSSPISDKVKSMIHKEFRKLDRSEKARRKKLELFKREAQVEISHLKLKEYKTKSQPVKFSCKARITALEMRKQELENQLLQTKIDKRQVINTLITVL
jgi:hypothetical protein